AHPPTARTSASHRWRNPSHTKRNSTACYIVPERHGQNRPEAVRGKVLALPPAGRVANDALRELRPADPQAAQSYPLDRGRRSGRAALSGAADVAGGARRRPHQRPPPGGPADGG